MQRPLKRSMILLLILQTVGCAGRNGDWRSASRDSAGIVSAPLDEAQVYVMAARAFSWRGYVGVHPWISFKGKGETNWTVLQVIGWRLRRGLEAVSISRDLPDRKWFGSTPDVVDVLRGKTAELAIPKIIAAVQAYPAKNEYRVFPGPNSNTFVAHIIREVDELKVELPPTAIGKDWLFGWNPFAISQTGTGLQFSLFGVLGFTVGLRDGIEINILGLSSGIDLITPAIKLPIAGRLGFKERSPTE